MSEKPNPTECAAYLGFTEIDGQRYPPTVLPGMHEQVKTFEVRDDDVFIVTYSKAGTHWMTEIVKTILADGDYKKGMDMFGSNPAILEYFNTATGIANIPHEQQRVVVTHLQEELLPKAVFNGKVKVIFVMRNPKDTVVSYFHFARPFHYSAEWETWEAFLQSFMSEDMPGCSWFNYNLSYWKHRNDKNFYFTTYEDMRMGIRAVIKNVADFLGHPVSDSALEEVVAISDFSRMNKKYDGKMPSTAPSSAQGIPFNILRKGCVGDWRNTFTVSQNEAFDELYEKKMQNSNMKEMIKFDI